LFSSEIDSIMSTITPEEFAQLQEKFSEIKRSINNVLAVMMALSEMSQRRPDYSEKLASTVLTKVPQIVSSLREFTQALNEKAGAKEFAQLQKKFSEINFSITKVLAVMMALSERALSGEKARQIGQRHYSEKLASTVLTKVPQIVSSLQEFTQALNEKAGAKPQ
jgi:chromosome condensin MukBEF ATPase and DNA-binding subunit MukB